MLPRVYNNFIENLLIDDYIFHCYNDTISDMFN